MTRLNNPKVLLGKNFELDLPIKSGCKPLTMLWVHPGTF